MAELMGQRKALSRMRRSLVYQHSRPLAGHFEILAKAIYSDRKLDVLNRCIFPQYAFDIDSRRDPSPLQQSPRQEDLWRDLYACCLLSSQICSLLILLVSSARAASRISWMVALAGCHSRPIIRLNKNNLF